MQELNGIGEDHQLVVDEDRDEACCCIASSAAAKSEVMKKKSSLVSQSLICSLALHLLSHPSLPMAKLTQPQNE